MVNGRIGSLRRAGFAMLVITLVAVIAICAGVLYWAMQSSATTSARNDRELRDYLTKIAALATGVMILTVVILFGVVIHYVAARISLPPEKFVPSTYENAWAEAGRRLKPEDAPPVAGFEDGGEDEQDTPPQ